MPNVIRCEQIVPHARPCAYNTRQVSQGEHRPRKPPEAKSAAGAWDYRTRTPAATACDRRAPCKEGKLPPMLAGEKESITSAAGETHGET